MLCQNSASKVMTPPTALVTVSVQAAHLIGRGSPPSLAIGSGRAQPQLPAEYAASAAEVGDGEHGPVAASGEAVCQWQPERDRACGRTCRAGRHGGCPLFQLQVQCGRGCELEPDAQPARCRFDRFGEGGEPAGGAGVEVGADGGCGAEGEAAGGDTGASAGPAGEL